MTWICWKMMFGEKIKQYIKHYILPQHCVEKWWFKFAFGKKFNKHLIVGVFIKLIFRCWSSCRLFFTMLTSSEKPWCLSHSSWDLVSFIPESFINLKKILALKQNPNIPFLETKRSSISLTPKPSPLANLTPRWHLCTLGTQDLEVTFCLHGMTIQLL